MGTGARERPGPPAAGRGRVLVVDDEPGVREGCRRVLAVEGHAVETAADARHGLRKIGRASYDVVLVDVKMPDMSGLDMLRAIRRLDPAAACVVITGYASYETAVAATKQGAYDFLAKPFTPDELAVKVARAREHHLALLAARQAQEEAESRLLELDAERGRLRTVVNCMADGVLVTNREGLLVLGNPAALRLLGLTGADPVGQPAAVALGSAELVAAIGQVLGGGGRRGAVARELAGPPEAPGGPGRSLTASVAPVRDARGELLGAVTVLHDVTRERELERARSRFVALVSHELRAPLGAVRTYLGLLAAGRVAAPDEQRQLLQRAGQRVDALLGLVDDLLELARLARPAEAGRQAELAGVAAAGAGAAPGRRVEAVEPAAVLREVARLFEPAARERGIRVEDRLPAELPRVAADRRELERVFTNLVSNAVKYNRPGGCITLSGSLAGGVEAGAPGGGRGSEGGWVRLAVADTGLGIAAAELPSIFEEFHRVRTPETREIVGTGLGLAIARRLVEAAQGRIEVRSEPGRGSTFAVLLPVPAGEPAPGGPAGGERAAGSAASSEPSSATSSAASEAARAADSEMRE